MNILTRVQALALQNHDWASMTPPQVAGATVVYDWVGDETPHQAVEVTTPHGVVDLRVYGGIYEASVQGTGVTFQGEITKMASVVGNLTRSGSGTLEI